MNCFSWGEDVFLGVGFSEKSRLAWRLLLVMFIKFYEKARILIFISRFLWIFRGKWALSVKMVVCEKQSEECLTEKSWDINYIILIISYNPANFWQFYPIEIRPKKSPRLKCQAGWLDNAFAGGLSLQRPLSLHLVFSDLSQKFNWRKCHSTLINMSKIGKGVKIKFSIIKNMQSKQ